MSVLEMQKKEVIQLLEVIDNEKLLEEVLTLLKKEKQRLTPQEIFEKVAARYDNTLRRLAQ
jgi:cobalamin biosynthesis protein CbiD